MKNFFPTRPLFYFPIFLLTAFAVVEVARHRVVAAGPSTAPSAMAAIRLKYYPPNNWIRHYLGDDRYKIAGGVWKVVSTQMDRYYHRATCPNMLRQPAGIVIGFANAAEAEEAGYAADPTCAPQAPAVTYAAVSTANGSSTNPLAPATRNTRITLSDGVSTTILPAGWIHVKNDATKIPITNTYGSSFDLLIPASAVRTQGKKPPMIVFMFLKTPDGSRVEPILTPAKLSQLKEKFRDQESASEFVKTLDNSKTTSAMLGGLRGIRATPNNAQGGLSGLPATVVGRGSKLYAVVNGTTSATKGASVVLRSFQPR